MRIRQGASLAAALAIGIAALALLGLGPAALAAMSEGQAAASEPLQPAQPGADEQSPCIHASSKVAAPETVTVGDAIDITMTVKTVCPADERPPLHIALVLDASGSMAGAPNRLMQDAAEHLIRLLDLDANASVKVGIVQFASSAQVLCHLTNDEEELLACIGQVGASGGSRPGEGIDAAIDELEAGRTGVPRGSITEVMIVLSDGPIQGGCDAVLEKAREARGKGILIIAVCISDACDEDCMRQVASSPRYYFQTPGAAGLVAVFARLLERIPDMSIREIVITDTLSADVRYVPDSAEPPQTAPSRPEGWLSWHDRGAVASAVTITYQVVPQELGQIQTSVSTVGRFVDWRGRSRVWLFNAPQIEVLPPATPTAMGTAPTATATPFPLKDPYEVGDHCRQSEAWEYLEPDIDYKATLHDEADEDWYVSRLLQPGRDYYFEMRPPDDQDYDLELYDVLSRETCRRMAGVDHGHMRVEGGIERIGPVRVSTSKQVAVRVYSPLPGSYYDPHHYYHLRMTADPEATPTPENRVLFLPLAAKRQPICAVATDVALVIDTSESMREHDAACGASKLECARKAVIRFLLVVNLDRHDGDQAAVVAFNGDARVVHPLSSDRASLLHSVGTLATSQGTRLDLGIAGATEELGSTRRRPGNVPAIVVLTDGRVQPVPPRLAIEEAKHAKDLGVLIFVIGLGNEVQVETLKAVATEEDFLYLAPDADELESIYEQIAARLAQPGGRP